MIVTHFLDHDFVALESSWAPLQLSSLSKARLEEEEGPTLLASSSRRIIAFLVNT